jgi:hypothetical protein
MKMSDETFEDDGVNDFRVLFATMSEDAVRLWARALLPNLRQRLLFDALTRCATKAEVDLIAAQSLVRVRIFRP